MALKFEIVEGNLKITNTQNNSVVVLFSKQNIAPIANIILDTTSPVVLYNIPKGYNETIFRDILSNCVDGTNTPFTPETFLEFCELNLGFNSPGATGTITVTDSYLTLPAANTQTGKFYWCQNSGGVYLTGLYYSNGTTWETSEADEIQVVANYDALPDPTTVPGQFYWCETSQGSNWNPFTGPFKNSGMYYSNGTSWTFLNVPYQATQAEVNAGLNDDKFVTPNTLAGWFTNIKTLVQSISGIWTFQNGIVFSPLTNPAYQKGLLFYDNSTESMSYYDDISGTTANICQEEFVRARNNTGSIIPNGSVVYITGALGQNPTIGLAQANDLATCVTIGVATHDIGINNVGKVTTFGNVNDYDTSAYTDGQFLFLSPTVAGGFTTTAPSSPNYFVYVCQVLHAHPTQGKLFVRPELPIALNVLLADDNKVSPSVTAVKTYIDAGLILKLNKPQTLRVSTNITLTATTASQKLFGNLGSNGDGSFNVEVGRYKVNSILKFQTLGTGEFGFITGISDGISTFSNIMIFVNGGKKAFTSVTQSSITTLNESFTLNPMISSTSSVQTGFVQYDGEFDCTTAGKLFPGISLGVAVSALFLSNSFYTITKLD